jgi:hypothetical protein
MSSVRKRLGATTVTADTDTSLYVVPANTETIVSTILVCNRGTTTATYRVAHVDGDISAVASEDYVVYDATVPANDSVPLTIGITMQATHSLLVRSSSTSVSFIAWGTETTASANPSDIGRTIVGGRLERTSDSYLEWQSYINGSIGIYNGSAWSLVTPSSNPSLQNTANDLDNNALTYDYNYDIFAEWVSSSSFYLRAKKWSGDTTRGFTLYRHEGVLVLDNTANGVKRRFLGTVRLRNDSGAKFTDTKNQRLVANFYNKVSKSLGIDNPYTSNTEENMTAGSWRSWDSNGDVWVLKFVVVEGTEINVLASMSGYVGNGGGLYCAVGFDSKTADGLTHHQPFTTYNISGNIQASVNVSYTSTPSQGYHYLYPLVYRPSGGTAYVRYMYNYNTGNQEQCSFEGLIRC